ncbi:MAG: HNH endonuclease, partial [Bdellovibrionales bacterium]
LEADHIVPRAHGGGDDILDLRFLCRSHNQFEAEEKLGKEWANRWRY